MKYKILEINLNNSKTVDTHFSKKTGKAGNCRIIIPQRTNQQDIEEISKVAIRELIEISATKNNLVDENDFDISINRYEKTESEGLIDLRFFYEFHQFVRIRDGVKDFRGFDLSSLPVLIEDFYQDKNNDIYFLRWSSQALSQLPPAYFINAKKDEYTLSGIHLSHDLILPSTYEEPESALDLKLKEIYLSLANPEIKRVWKNDITGTGDMFSTLEEHFKRTFAQFPEISILMDDKKITSPAIIAGSDRKNGLWVQLSRELLPLADIAENITDSKLRSILNLYLDWYQNICYG